MTQGENGTTTASVLVYRQMYEFQLAGYASALAFLLFTVILFVTVAQYRLGERQVNY
jgi:ABC-type sugar transport system permease subunit